MAQIAMVRNSIPHHSLRVIRNTSIAPIVEKLDVKCVFLDQAKRSGAVHCVQHAVTGEYDSWGSIDVSGSRKESADAK